MAASENSKILQNVLKVLLVGIRLDKGITILEKNVI